MNREEKTRVIQSLRNGFEKTEAAFLVGVKGLTVSQLQVLRRDLRGAHSHLRIAKARLMKRAVDGLEGIDQMGSYFKTQVGLVFVDKEAPAVAKVLRNFAKENEALKLVIGYIDDRIFDSQSIERIALIPSREILLSQFAALLNAPVAQFARVLGQVAEKRQS
jgi:large subunit ribosomal protein L10